VRVWLLGEDRYNFSLWLVTHRHNFLLELVTPQCLCHFSQWDFWYGQFIPAMSDQFLAVACHWRLISDDLQAHYHCWTGIYNF
jgi:hypothetical protein